MKKIWVLVVTVFSLVLIFNISEAKKAVRKSNPCVSACQGEYRKCIQTAKKLKRGLRQKKIKECKNQRSVCVKKCRVKKNAKSK